MVSEAGQPQVSRSASTRSRVAAGDQRQMLRRANSCAAHVNRCEVARRKRAEKERRRRQEDEQLAAAGGSERAETFTPTGHEACSNASQVAVSFAEDASITLRLPAEIADLDRNESRGSIFPARSTLDNAGERLGEDIEESACLADFAVSSSKDSGSSKSWQHGPLLVQEKSLPNSQMLVRADVPVDAILVNSLKQEAEWRSMELRHISEFEIPKSSCSSLRRDELAEASALRLEERQTEILQEQEELTAQQTQLLRQEEALIDVQEALNRETAEFQREAAGIADSHGDAASGSDLAGPRDVSPSTEALTSVVAHEEIQSSEEAAQTLANGLSIPLEPAHVSNHLSLSAEEDAEAARFDAEDRSQQESCRCLSVEAADIAVADVEELERCRHQLELERAELAAARREMGDRFFSLQRRQFEVQRDRDDIRVQRSSLDDRLQHVDLLQQEFDAEKEKYYGKRQALNQRFHSLRAHQLELQEEQESIEAKRQELGQRWGSLKQKQLEADEESAAVASHRAMLEDWEAHLKEGQEDVNEQACAICLKEEDLERQLRQAREREAQAAVNLEAAREREDMVAGNAAAVDRSRQEVVKEKEAIKAERLELQRFLEEAVSDCNSQCVMPPPYWRSNSLHRNPRQSGSLQVPWPQGGPALLAMLRESAVHSCCAGRDGNFVIGGIRSVNVWRVENIETWRQYRNKAVNLNLAKRDIRALSPPPHLSRPPSCPDCLQARSLDSSINEVFLWHGTTFNNIDIIAKDGMDERVCNLDGMFGAGLYFATDSCKSGQYAARDANGSHWFLLCRVMLGNAYVTRAAMQGLRRPPFSLATTYHSVDFQPDAASAVGHHRELIVYDRHQVYPEYIVEAVTR